MSRPITSRSTLAEVSRELAHLGVVSVSVVYRGGAWRANLTILDNSGRLLKAALGVRGEPTIGEALRCSIAALQQKGD